LFFLSGQKVLSASIEPGRAPSGPFRAGTPRLLFEGRFAIGNRVASAYDVSPDGKRSLKIKYGGPEAASGAGSDKDQQLHFVLEWFEEVRRRVQSGAAQ